MKQRTAILNTSHTYDAGEVHSARRVLYCMHYS